MRRCCCSWATGAWRIALCCSLWGPYIMQLCDKASVHQPWASFALLDSHYEGGGGMFMLSPAETHSCLRPLLFLVIPALDIVLESWWDPPKGGGGSWVMEVDDPSLCLGDPEISVRNTDRKVLSWSRNQQCCYTTGLISLPRLCCTDGFGDHLVASWSWERWKGRLWSTSRSAAEFHCWPNWRWIHWFVATCAVAHTDATAS